MKKYMIALAGFCAIALTANAADTWFDGGIETGWPEATSMKGGSWSNTNGSSYADSKVTVSADESTPLTFSADAEKNPAKTNVTIKAALTFTPFTTALPDLPETAKAGVVLYKDTFYVVGKSGEDKAWVSSGITTNMVGSTNTADVDVTFLDSSNVVYKIGNSVSTNAIVVADTIKYARMSGDGAISSLSATYEEKATGPQTPATGGGSVKKVADNVYEATPSPEGNVTIVDGTLGADDIIRITVTNDMTVTGVPEKQIQVVLHDTQVSNSVFVGGSPFSTALNKEGSAVIGTETIQVVPQLSGTDEAIKPFVLDDNAAVGVKTIPGLTYKLVRQVVLGTNEKTVDSAVATESRTQLQDKNKPEDKAFYIIEVTK